MIDVLQACILVTEHVNRPYISEITDIGHSFVIPTVNKYGEAPLEPACVVNKNTGEITCFRRSKENYAELNKGKQVEIPEKYRYPGEIRY